MPNLHATLFCGQCFGWHEEEGVYQSVVHGKLVHFSQESFLATIKGDAALAHYFDMDGEYHKAFAHLAQLDTKLERALSLFGGLHILNQDPFEVLLSFILSQNNNIPRIRQMYRTLAHTFGTSVAPRWYAFPRAQEMQGVTEEHLRDLGMGFRAPYIVDAIEKHSILDEVPHLDFARALSLLMTIKGVGPKVGTCILLYGFHRMEAFPMDVWMKKIMHTWYPGKDARYFAPYAGIAQQYLFHLARTEAVV